MRLAHLALVVWDRERSRRFYERYFGFGAGTARAREDGVLFIRDPQGFDLALGEGEPPSPMPAFLHFGFRVGAPEQVRAIRSSLQADGVELVELSDEHDYVSCKCRDPDGYVVEVYWEPADPPAAGPPA